MRPVWLAGCAALAIVGCSESRTRPSTTDAGALEDARSMIEDAGTVQEPDAGGVSDAGGGTRRYGEACSRHADCASGVCIGTTDVAPTCTRTCDSDAPNDCRDENTFCVSFTEGEFCFGATIETGIDASDDEVLNLGDCVTRSLSPLGDADMFLVLAGRSADISVVAQPQNPALDVAVDFYNNGQLVGRSDDYGGGGMEGLRIADFARGSRMQVVVRDGGSSITDEYRLCVMIN